MTNSKEPAFRIAEIIHNQPLADAICDSISKGLGNKKVHLTGDSIWKAFTYSLDAAVRDIETHPRGKLFKRFLEYGPLNPDEPEKLTSDGETTLSDPECGECVQFIFSHMVNRFKGELAELLAISPCLELIGQLQAEGKWSSSVDLYLGETVWERRQIKRDDHMDWGEFVKGADGLIVEPLGQRSKGMRVRGIMEVKSMLVSETKLRAQLKHHLDRMAGGLRLNEHEWEGSQVIRSSPVYIMVIPSNWKLSREYHFKDDQLILPDPVSPPPPNRIKERAQNTWKITLAWSKEALEQAAYEMTYWYMSQVGKVIYQKKIKLSHDKSNPSTGSRGVLKTQNEKKLPKGWEGMTPEEAGYNAIKMMLYYLMLRYITKEQDKLATKLYNAYCFGYPLAVDSKEMLWPEDVRLKEPKP